MKRLLKIAAALAVAMIVLSGCTKLAAFKYSGWWISSSPVGTVPHTSVSTYRLIYLDTNGGGSYISSVFDDKNAWNEFNKQFEKLTNSSLKKTSTLVIKDNNGESWYKTTDTKTYAITYAIDPDSNDQLAYYSEENKKIAGFIALDGEKLEGYRRIKR